MKRYESPPVKGWLDSKIPQIVNDVGAPRPKVHSGGRSAKPGAACTEVDLSSRQKAICRFALIATGSW